VGIHLIELFLAIKVGHFFIHTSYGGVYESQEAALSDGTLICKIVGGLSSIELSCTTNHLVFHEWYPIFF